jgi:hypothetical protein
VRKSEASVSQDAAVEEILAHEEEVLFNLLRRRGGLARAAVLGLSVVVPRAPLLLRAALPPVVVSRSRAVGSLGRGRAWQLQETSEEALEVFVVVQDDLGAQGQQQDSSSNPRSPTPL